MNSLNRKKNSAVQYLSKDFLLHMDMLESLAGETADLLWCGTSGVLLFQTVARAYMMSAEDEETASGMLRMIPQVDLFVAHQDFYVEAVQRKYGFTRSMECFQAVYRRKEPLPEIHNSIEICRLDEKYLPFLRKHYAHADDSEYLLERLKAGAMYGAFDGESLTGFIGTHEEGSMGMLEILPEYRRRGIASILETFLVNRILTAGRIPFAQIEIGNEASLALHQALGFSISVRTLSWLMKE